MPEVDWEMILNTTFMGNGTAWFRDPGEPKENDVTAPEASMGFGFELDDSEFPDTRGYSKYFIHAFKDDEGNLRPGWSRQFAYAKSKSLSESRLASRIEKAFEAIGLKISRTGTRSPDDEFVGFWQNDIGIPFVQYGGIFESDEGVESLVWSTDIFLNSKKISEQPADSWALKIPSLVEAMMYLAEAPLKQSFFTMSREISETFEGVRPENIPHPGIGFNEAGFALVAAKEANGDIGLRRFACPTVIDACYDVSENLSDQELIIVMEALSNAFVSLSTQTCTAFDSSFTADDTGLMSFFEATGMVSWIEMPDGTQGMVVGRKGMLVPACYNVDEFATSFLPK